MRARLVRRTALMALVVCALAAPAWAALQFQNKNGTLNNVDASGNLTSAGAQATTFLCLVNTTSGGVIALGNNFNVTNASQRLQIYFNNSAFGSITGVTVTSNLYLVGPFGWGSLIASGTLVPA